jgi:hypothetical protein
MFKVKVQNEINGMSYGATFGTQAFAQAWIDKQVKKCSWGKPERWIKTDELTPELVARVKDTKVEEEISYSLVPDDYTIEIIDEETDQAFKDQMNKRRRAEEMPTLQEKVDALLEGGQALANLKTAIAQTRAKYPVSNE